MYRRRFLVGAGGVMMALPFLEGLTPRTAQADGAAPVPPFMVFYRKPNGVAQKGRQLQRNCPEKYWPDLPSGTTLTEANCPNWDVRSTGAMGPAHWKRATLLRGLAHPHLDWGHDGGIVQMMTGAGITWDGVGRDRPNHKVLGESIDNRIARELTGKEESLAIGYGNETGSSYSFLRSASENGSRIERRFAVDYPALFDQLFKNAGTDSATFERLRLQRKSVNDALRTRLAALAANPKLSKSDKERLDLHTSSIRDLEKLLCDPSKDGSLRSDAERAYADRDGHNVGHGRRAAADIASRITALAISCGATRSAVFNSYPSAGDDAHYDDEFPVEWSGIGKMHEDISHCPDFMSDPKRTLAHQCVDKGQMLMFKMFLDRLDAYDFGGGKTLLDAGVCVYASEIGQGCHGLSDTPYIYVGGAGGRLKTGVYIDKLKTNDDAARGSDRNIGAQRMQHFEPPVKLLNTIGAALGCKSGDGRPLHDFNADNNGGISGRFDDLYLGPT